MSRWSWLWICALVGMAMLICGLLVPAHLRAVDARVIERAGRGTPFLVERGLVLVNERRLGAAQMLSDAPREEKSPGWEKLASAVNNLVHEHPELRVLGAPAGRLEKFLVPSDRTSEPFTDWAVRSEHREKMLEELARSQDPTVRELLRTRGLTNTVVFPPSQSSSGQAFDAAVAVCGWLVDDGRLPRSLSDSIYGLAAMANGAENRRVAPAEPEPDARSRNSQLFEQVLLDFMSLGQRFDWGQLATVVSRVEDVETLRLLANFARAAAEAPESMTATNAAGAIRGGQLALLFAAVELSGQPSGVVRYLSTYSLTGMHDLRTCLGYGAGGIKGLLQRNERLYISTLPQRLAVGLCWKKPALGLALKWALYLCGGFLLATALHFAWPMASALERPLQVRGFHLAREGLFALGFLAIVLLLSEPFLVQESQKTEFPLRLRLPMAVSAGGPTAGSPSIKVAFMNDKTLMPLLLFFVLQGLLYVACLVKLAEIRRQRVAARIRLKLLENEDHLFDAGLYLGFVGTIISLILFSLGVIKPSLMAAYSSTSFGIIFVSFFKIFHLRPLRRRLLLEAESDVPQPVAPPLGARPVPTPS